MGGLGNQLFQYAFALSLSKEYGRKVIIDPNFVAIRLDENGLPEIGNFLLDSSITIAESTSYPVFFRRLVGLGIRISLQIKKPHRRFALFLINRLLEVFLSMYFREHVRIIFGSDNGFDKRYIQKKYSIYLGYFQSHKFSSSIEVKESLIALKPKVSSLIVNSFKEKAIVDEPLIVHVRLTDYRNEPNFGIPTMDYYEKAISNQLQTGRYSKIWLFSDEPDEAMEYVPIKYHSLVENISAQNLGTIETLEVMRLGRGYVIANSSFSWWGAFLSHSDDVQIIFPSPWFSGMPTPKYLCPPNWLPFTR